MPNHMLNILTINGTDEEVKAVKEFLQVEKHNCRDDEYFGLGTIDFNKITPMPKWVYKGIISSEQEEKYGAENCWYEWRWKNWGTKWNAYSRVGVIDSANEILFFTAFSSPVVLIQKLSLIFPNVEFEICWADEFIGGPVGIVNFKDGLVTYEEVPECGSKESIELFCKIKGYEPEDFEIEETF